MDVLPRKRVPAPPAARAGRRKSRGRSRPVLKPWLRAQSVNVARHAAALRPFRHDEFGKGPEAPTAAHVLEVNGLVTKLRKGVLTLSEQVRQAGAASIRGPTSSSAQRVLRLKDQTHRRVRAVETVWNYYFNLFSQRQSRFGTWLLGCDRVALDCYQVIFTGLGAAKSIPTPPPFSYMQTGRSPATFRRRVPLRRLGKQPNPFPLIQLPYHRLVNPWTLGAILHEVSHNLQNELGLARVVPRRLYKRLRQAGFSKSVAAVWTRWNRETFADLCGLLLGGPAVVGSLMDVVGRSPRLALTYNPRGVHPTPYLRIFLSLELLRRMDFAEQAERYSRAWQHLYPDPAAGTLPKEVLATAPKAIRTVVNTLCYGPYAALGDKRLAEVVRFAPKDQLLIEEASRRLAAGVDPGIIPERFLIGAARVALDNRLVRPGILTTNFYKALARR